MGFEERWDPDGIRQLRELYEPMRRFAAVIGKWDVDPDDLVQEAYTNILRKDPARIEDLAPYIRRVIVNLATDERRRRTKANGVVHRLDAKVTSTDSYPHDLEDLMRLPERARALLYLVEVEGHHVAAAAELVDMTHTNARVALMRARRRLRSELALEANGE